MLFSIMITALVAALVLISFGLVIAIPVALATPGEWDVTKYAFKEIFQVWISIVLCVAAIDGLSTFF